MKRIIIILLILAMICACSKLKKRDAYIEHLDYDVPGKYRLTPEMFKLLGMLSEYISRLRLHGIPRRDHVERFYPSEVWMVPIFEGLIERYEEETGMVFYCTRKVGPGGHITILSWNLTEVINSFYTRLGRKVTLNREILKQASVESKLAYIEGVYLRFGEEPTNSISMINGIYKVKTVAFTLKALGCPEAFVYTTSGGVPNCEKVIFQPTEEIKKRLKLTEHVALDYYQQNKHFGFHLVMK